jgi:integrase
MRVKLTNLFVESVEAPNSGQAEYWDTQAVGLGLRVSLGGRKAWTVVYRHAGRLRRLTLGSYPTLGLADARKLAKTTLLEAARGADPAREKKEHRMAETFGDLAELYLDKHARALKRTWKEDERIIEKELCPRWKNVKATEIRRKDVAALLDAIVVRKAPVMANRTKALISKIFNFGIRRGIVEANPALHVANPGKEEQRDRVLTDDEIRAVWTTLDSKKAWVAAVIKLGLLTAQRRGEVLGMRWSELDLDGAWWILPAERTKNGLAHRVALAPQAIQILRKLRTDQEKKRRQERKAETTAAIYVFPSPRAGHIRNLQKIMPTVRTDSGVEFRYHDLRRTAASLMAGIGISRLVVSKILNHVERGITAVYDRHSYDADKRDAAWRWEAHLTALLNSKKDGKLVSISAAS